MSSAQEAAKLNALAKLMGQRSLIEDQEQVGKGVGLTEYDTTGLERKTQERKESMKKELEKVKSKYLSNLMPESVPIPGLTFGPQINYPDDPKDVSNYLKQLNDKIYKHENSEFNTILYNQIRNNIIDARRNIENIYRDYSQKLPSNLNLPEIPPVAKSPWTGS